ncbi:hypothetical protein GcM1_179018 [Golovinomyces cichoracearum]|uniref:Uncharacterized protein n=1 Tax=Golovinomyces cichoracearum TaxID=62708 RepID=A0A420J4R1_9PEZI|nr:hypothetical protein GcM1_179018 [Golovinomyces cichoracearum]
MYIAGMSTKSGRWRRLESQEESGLKVLTLPPQCEDMRSDGVVVCHLGPISQVRVWVSWATHPT